jgi:hypothetical protein
VKAVKKTVLAVVAGMLLVGPALAQNNMGTGNPQQRNTKMTKTKVIEIGPDGLPFEKEETVNENLPTERTNAKGTYIYSGLPGKFLRKDAATGGQTGAAK